MFNFDADNKKIERATRKINYARKTLIGNGQHRNDQGFQYTANRILTSLQNFMDTPTYQRHDLGEALSEGLYGSMNFSRKKRNFAAGEVGSVADIDVVDISLAATVASHGLTYIAMERPMEAVGCQITFQGLKAVNSVSGFTAGQTVFDPRKALPTNIDPTRGSAEVSGYSTNQTSAGTGEETVALNSEVIRGTTKVVLVGTTSSGEGASLKITDVKTSDVLAFDTGRDVTGSVSTLLSKNGAVVQAGNVNLSTGSVKVTIPTSFTLANAKTLLGENSITGFRLKIVSCADRIDESSGDHTLKLRPFMDTTELMATENRIILQSSVEIQAQMNKILRKNAQFGIDVDFGKRAIDQIVSLYTYSIDTTIVRALWEGVASKDADATLDLSGFGAGGSSPVWGYNANVKNDALSRFTDQLCSALLVATNQPVTALIVDDVAAMMYSSDKESFIPDPAFLQRRDGFIGTYKGIPVVRNYVLHGKGGDGLGVVIGVFKSADGQCAPVAMGDYLPPYSTLPALNPANPGELSQALFSSTAIKSIVPGWSVKGLISPYGHPINS